VEYLQAALNIADVISVRQYERHSVDISQGQFVPLPFRYLGLCELSVDGSEDAVPIIDRIAALHRGQPAAEEPATWLYYPCSERIGRAPRTMPSPLTLAFANPLPGQDADFREWYVTRHIRHALRIPALVSGQCLQQTRFQRPGALQPGFDLITVYEQEGEPERVIEGIAALPAETFEFPMMDWTRFTEWVYRPVLS